MLLHAAREEWVVVRLLQQRSASALSSEDRWRKRPHHRHRNDLLLVDDHDSGWCCLLLLVRQRKKCAAKAGTEPSATEPGATEPAVHELQLAAVQRGVVLLLRDDVCMRQCDAGDAMRCITCVTSRQRSCSQHQSRGWCACGSAGLCVHPRQAAKVLARLHDARGASDGAAARNKARRAGRAALRRAACAACWCCEARGACGGAALGQVKDAPRLRGRFTQDR